MSGFHSVEPFPTLEPLQTYVNRLVVVTRDPCDMHALNFLMNADVVLTEKTVLSPQASYYYDKTVPVEFRPCTISDGVHDIACTMRGDPPAPYDTSHIENDIVRKVMEEFVAAQPDPRTMTYTQDALERQSRGALISLGGSLAVSGAVAPEQIGEAYRVIVDGISLLRVGDPEFVKFGAKRISRELLNEYDFITGHKRPTPIDRRQALENIDIAWQVVGRPFGSLTKAIGRVTAGVHF